MPDEEEMEGNEFSSKSLEPSYNNSKIAVSSKLRHTQKSSAEALL